MSKRKLVNKKTGATRTLTRKKAENLKKKPKKQIPPKKRGTSFV